MERESFEDADVAEFLNNNYVSIKVDREERPDIDSIYMQTCQLMTGSAGWPLTIIMDSERKPFFAGTYFPKKSFGSHIGFLDILMQIAVLWQSGRKRIIDAQNEIIEALKIKNIRSDKKLSSETVETAVNILKRIFDKEYGGFGNAPKFPSPHNIMLLMRFYYTHGDESSKEIALKTLSCMASGGIYDHIGYGFCRYSTDRMWLAPHFEKMLYDNALLAIAYTEAYLVTNDKNHKNVATQILTYILRDMTSPTGGFYSAEDADSEGVEGKFYVWDKKEITDILGKTEGKRFCEIYGITTQGNFEGKNIPNLINKNISETDAEFADTCIKKLFSVRERRPHPLKDKKILTSWNGLMIAAFAIAGKAFGVTEYIEAARKAVSFIFERLTDNGVLYTRFCDGEVLKKSFADDYAYMVWGLLELYQATYETDYLAKAISLNQRLLEDFYDNDAPGVFLYPKNSENILIRPKEIYDGATPSSNSVTAYNLIRLSRITGDGHYETLAADILNSFSQDIEKNSAAYTFALISLLYLNGHSREIIITAADIPSAQEVVYCLDSKFLPFTSTVVFTPSNSEISEIVAFVKSYPIPNAAWSAYICKNSSCLPAINSINALKKEI